MRTIHFLLSLILASGFTFGQNSPLLKQNNSNGIVEKCSQHTKTQQMLIDDPARFASIGKRSQRPYQEQYTPPFQEKVTGVIITIPVVFHVLHNNGTENISDAQIQNALFILNRDYRKLNADANNVVSAFTGMVADVEVEFKFATIAPNGACFNGITRTQSTLTNNGSSGQNQVNAIISGNNVYQGVWAHNKYLNIYVANEIGGAAGYTYLPNGASTANATNMYYNGIFILENYCGAIGTSTANTSRALTHEVGHWLNLPHVWGGGQYQPGDINNCGDDDGIQDTPNTVGSTTCALTANTCNSDDAYWGGPMVDNVENYMDYSYCSKMFTQGQVDEMRAALASSVGGRSNIWTTTNLQNVGAIGGTSLCSIDFEADAVNVCQGASVTFTPNTTAGISTYAWSFPGGTPSTSNVASPTVTYSTVGVRNATLTVTSSVNGQNYVKAKTNYITVNSNSTVNLPISEGFTATGTPTGWTIVNPNASTTTWARTTVAGNAPTAGNSFMFDNANFEDLSDDELQVSKFSTIGMGSSTLTFDVAYAPYNSTYYDGLEVLVSTDCGATFTSVYNKSYLTLATAPASTGLFSPTSAQWRTETIDLTPFINQGSVLVSFKNLAGYGNRLFIDNVNITAVPGEPTANFNASTSTICVDKTTTFTDASYGATSWSWNFGAGATPPTAIGVGPHTVLYSSLGSKTITLTIDGGDVATRNITVIAAPTPPTITAGGPTTFCAGGTVILTSSSTSGNTWSSGASTTSITVSNAGSYTVVKNNGSCNSAASSPIVVTVNPLPTVTIADFPNKCVYNPAFTLTQGSPAGGVYSGTGVTGNQFNPSVAGNGNHSITYTYTDANGCKKAPNKIIMVDGCLSIEEEINPEFSIFPNPSTGIFIVKSDGIIFESISVYNQLGQLILEQVSNNSEQEINMTRYASGVYTIRVNHAVGIENFRVVLDK